MGNDSLPAVNLAHDTAKASHAVGTVPGDRRGVIHDNSIGAYYATQSRRLSLEQRILRLMADGKARSDREIQRELDHPECLRPRVTTLVKTGYLHEVASKICEFSHVRVRLTKRFI